MLGFEIFIQQLVTIEVRDVAINTVPASIRTPTSYNESLEGIRGSSSLSLNAQIGAFGGAAGVIPSPICPSGNCTWPLYDTLALCTVCKDMTNNVAPSGDVFNINITAHLEEFAQGNGDSTTQTWASTYSFPNGNGCNVSVQLDLSELSAIQWDITYPHRTVWPLNIDPSADSLWEYTWDNKTYADIPSPLFAMGHLEMNLTADHSSLVIQQATECVFSPCVRTMHTEVRKGQTLSNITATDYGAVIINRENPDGSSSTGWTAHTNSTEYSIISGGIGDAAGDPLILIQAVRIALEGSTNYSYGGFWYPDPAQRSNSRDSDTTAFTPISGAWSSVGQQAIDVSGDFTNVVNGVGKALTGRFQQLQDTAVTGTSLVTDAVVVVRWAWIAYPLALIALCLLSLFSTIVTTHHNKMALWKESTLPLLYAYKGNAWANNSGWDQEDSGSQRFLNHGPETGLISDRVSSIVSQAASERVQLRRRISDDRWILSPTGGEKEWRC